MDGVEIKKVTLNEIDRLQNISRQTFYETYSAVNTKENMSRYLEENFSTERLSLELINEHTVFYFAIIESEVIGYIKLNFMEAQTEQGLNDTLEIERIYVLSEYHGKNVGQLLFQKAVSLAKEEQMDYVWLGVWEKNPKAIRFYEKNGFVAFGTHLFLLGEDEQNDILMKLDL